MKIKIEYERFLGSEFCLTRDNVVFKFNGNKYAMEVPMDMSKKYLEDLIKSNILKTIDIECKERRDDG